MVGSGPGRPDRGRRPGAAHGYDVTVFEALHKAGGVLVYGIPEFRLPKEIVQKEVDYLEQLGVKFKYNFVVGKTAPMKTIVDEFDAVFVGTGAGLPRFMSIPGENLLGVYSANEYLTRANLMKAYSFPETDTPIITGKTVATIGGGNVAMDSARTAAAHGRRELLIVYRRAEEADARPARGDPPRQGGGCRVPHAAQPRAVSWATTKTGSTGVELHQDGAGRARRLRPTQSRYPSRAPSSSKDLDAVIVAIGNSPNPLVPRDFPELEVTRWGGIVVNEATGQTNIPGVFAGGDIVLGAATVILAMGHGRQAAKAINLYLSSGRWSDLEEALSTERADVR